MDNTETTAWTVGQLRAELVGLSDDLPITVLVQVEPGGTFYATQMLVSAGYGEEVDRDDPALAGAPFPFQTQFPTPPTDERTPPSTRRH